MWFELFSFVYFVNWVKMCYSARDITCFVGLFSPINNQSQHEIQKQMSLF